MFNELNGNKELIIIKKGSNQFDLNLKGKRIR